MTVVVLRLKGAGDTLKKGFDALTAAFNSLGPAPQVIKHVNGSSPKQLNGGSSSQEVAEEYIEDDDVDEELESAPVAAPAKPTPSQRSKPKFLNDFDLSVSDEPWTEFANASSPKTENEKYLVASLWITENAGIAEFGITHVFTCFRAMKWKEQTDFSQPMRFHAVKEQLLQPSSCEDVEVNADWPRCSSRDQECARRIGLDGPSRTKESHAGT
jgi:hypothetical protein